MSHLWPICALGLSLAFASSGPSSQNIKPKAAPVAGKKAVVSDSSERVFTNRLGMSLLRVPAGTFSMGFGSDEEGQTHLERTSGNTPHSVTLSKPFWMAKTHVTVGQFRQFVKATGHKTEAEKEGFAWGVLTMDKEPGRSWRNPGFKQNDRHPVVCVSWQDAQAFVAWLNDECPDKAYRLPTEAEWERAARGGMATGVAWGKDPEAATTFANLADAALHRKIEAVDWALAGDDGWAETAPVATYKANAFGLYDMLGNAWQWCQDWHGPYPNGGSVVNPKGPSKGEARVLRGGSWATAAGFCHPASRRANGLAGRSSDIGFRVVCGPGQAM